MGTPAPAAGRREGAMIISRVSVQRPVFAIMITAAIIVVGWFSIPSARPRSDAEDRRPGRQRVRVAARRQRRGGRDPDHQAARRGGQHHQRHRRAARQLGSGTGEPDHLLRARTRHRGRHSGRPRQGGGRASEFPERHVSARRPESRSGRGAGSDTGGVGLAESKRSSPPSSTSRSSRSSRPSKTSARSRSSAIGTAKSICCSTPIG